MTRMRLPVAALLLGLGMLFASAGANEALALSNLADAVAKPETNVAQAQARHRFTHFRHHRPHRWYGHHHHRHWRGYWGPGLFYSFSAAPYVSYRYSYRDDCGWLRRKYNNTGSRYWWRRYVECRGW